MNLNHVEYRLKLAVELLEECREAIRSGELSSGNESGLGDNLGEVLDYLCVAWNGRNLATHEVGHSSTAKSPSA